MATNQSQQDLILLVPTNGPVLIDPQVIRQACSIVESRLSCDAIVTDSLQSQRLQSQASSHETIGFPRSESYGRTVIVPCGFESLSLAQIRSDWWFGRLPGTTKIFLGEPWTPKEVGNWISNRARCTKDIAKSCIRLPLFAGLSSGLRRTEDEVQTIALIAFWANRDFPNSVTLIEEPCETSQDSSELTIGNLSATDIDAEDVATWMIQRYLRSVRTRPIPWNEDGDADWPQLNRLQNQLHLQLPSEYTQRLDDVSPRSMGSAKILPDDSGRIPWDKIWTSFCDLAMAGGPPHRGKLLEPVQFQASEESLEAYRAVVNEVRRGIGLASGLRTCDSPYLGWVCVECDDEQMAAWLMRAILVENISVRRENNLLYLPAGPEFRIDKEIKNVITAVAKTNHYWGAHLRSRQPPNPL